MGVGAIRGAQWGVSLLLCASLSGCGVILTGTRDTIPIETSEPGAEVWVDGVMVGRTPVTVDVVSSEEHTVVIKVDGQEDRTLRLERHLSGGWIIADIIIAGVLVGVLVDALTGGWYTTYPETLQIDLGPPEGAQPVEGSASE